MAQPVDDLNELRFTGAAEEVDLFDLHSGYGLPPRHTVSRPRYPRRPALAPQPAAGVLCRYTDHEGTWILLGLRAPFLGGCWANLGGSLDAGEEPLTGALREFHEETLLPVAALVGATISAVLDCGDAAKPYTMFVLDVPRYFDGMDCGWEHDDLAWWHTDDVADQRLHPKFAAAWAELQGSAS